jgi:hypothetical protein
MSNSSPPETSKEQMIFDIFNKEIDRLDTRTDWFLIFHGILLESYAATKDVNALTQTFVGVLGFVTATIWFFAGLRQRQIMVFQGGLMMNSKFAGHLAESYKAFILERRKEVGCEWAKPDRSFAVAIPFLVAALWLAVLAVFSVPKEYDILNWIRDDHWTKWAVPLVLRVTIGPLIVLACWRMTRKMRSPEQEASPQA